jgi:Protein of unknown function (DUF4238)
MSEPKHHHYIPETYLENFCGADRALWLYDKWEGRSFPSKPDSVLKQHLYYAQPDHERKTWNYNLEHFFSEKIETRWPATVQMIESGPKTARGHGARAVALRGSARCAEHLRVTELAQRKAFLRLHRGANL